MKKGVFVAVVALVLAMSLPALAFAGDSPKPTTKTAGVAGNSLTISGNETDINKLIVETSANPTNVPTTSYNFTVYMSDQSELTGPVTLTFDVGVANAGKTYTLYCVHGMDLSGAAQSLATGTVASDGTVTYTINALSYYSVVLGEGGGTGTGTDTSAKSPSTGADFGGVGAVALVAVVAAGGALYLLRRKNEQ